MSTSHIAHNPWGTLVLLMAQALSPDLGSSDGPPRPEASRVPSAPKLGLLDRLDRWLWRQRQRTTEAWLAQSADLFELEARMRWLDRPYGSRYY